MGKALIIAEKPSVASDISKALGKFQKHEDYFENDQFVISSAGGHLLTIVPPPGVEAAKGKWAFKNLPVIPPHFDLEPIERSEGRLRVLKKLIKRDDVTELINALPPTGSLNAAAEKSWVTYADLTTTFGLTDCAPSP